MTDKIRLHLLAIPHTITRDEFSHCAFTGKVQRFSPMLRSRGFEVYHYGVATSQSGASVDVDLLTVDEWTNLRSLSYQHLNPTASIEEVKQKLADPTAFIGDLANWDTPLYKEFNARTRTALIKNYRSTKTDIICLPFGPAHNAAFSGLGFVVVETGIGYSNAEHSYRIYESYAVLHSDIARCKKGPQNYWFVAPNYYNMGEWPFYPVPTLIEPEKVLTIDESQPRVVALPEGSDDNTEQKITRPRIGFFGRIGASKGVNIILEVARKFPNVDFVICGQGDPSQYLVEPNMIYKAPIHGQDRHLYLGSLTALIAPSNFMEPFCGANVEAQLCGTPVIAHEHGAFTETVEPFKTGLLCHTLADFCVGVQMALDGKFDRAYVRRRAVAMYDLFQVAKRYEYIFQTIADVHNGKNGWYSPDSYITVLQDYAIHE